MFLEREKKKILSTYHRPAPREERERGLYKMIRGASAPAQESLAPRWRLSSLAMAAKRSVETRCGTGAVGREGEPLASLTAAFGSDRSPPRVQLADLGLIASSLRGPCLICKRKLRHSISNHEPHTHVAVPCGPSVLLLGESFQRERAGGSSPCQSAGPAGTQGGTGDPSNSEAREAPGRAAVQTSVSTGCLQVGSYLERYFHRRGEVVAPTFPLPPL